MALPPDVRRHFGYALSLAQMGDVNRMLGV